MIRSSTALALLAITPLAAAATDPYEVATTFYAAMQGPPPSTSAIAPLLGPSLRAAVDAQHAYEQACIALAARDVKPHMLDQSPYLLAPDWPETVHVVRSGARGDAAWISVEMMAGGYRWTDRVLLQKQAQDWKIMDIRWGQGGSLIGRLKQFSAVRCVP